MTHVLVERVLLSRLRRTFGDGDIALLAHDMQHGSPTAARLLDDAAGTQVRFASDMLVGTLEMSPGLGWSAGMLLDARGSMSQTIVHAVMGMPLSTFLHHPDVDPAAIIGPPLETAWNPRATPIGILSVEPEGVPLEVPASPLAMPSHWRRIRRRRMVDVPTATGVRWTFAVTATFMTGIAGMHVHALWRMHTAWTMELAYSVVFGLLSIMFWFINIDAATGRALSERLMGGETNHQAIASTWHDMHMREEYQRRGFDDFGQPA